MAYSMGLIGFVGVIVVASLLQFTAAQTNHVVGGTMGWTIPSTQSYATWANSQKFIVGDTLTFNFNSAAHDVAQVTKPNFDSCGTSNTISLITKSPATITLNTTGDHYYICTFSGHCGAGQKVAINVVSSSATAPSTPPTGSTTPPPQSGSVPSPAPTSAGTTPPPKSGSPSPAPTSAGTTPPPKSGSPSPAPTSAGTTPPPKSGGPSPAPTSGVTTPPPKSGSPPPTPTSAGTTPSPTSDGPSSTPTSGGTAPPPNSAPSLVVGFGVAGISAAILSAFFL